MKQNHETTKLSTTPQVSTHVRSSEQEKAWMRTEDGEILAHVVLRLDQTSRVILSLVGVTFFTAMSLGTAAATTLRVTLSRVLSSILSMNMTAVLATTLGLTFNVNLITVLSVVPSVTLSTAVASTATTTATTTATISLTTSAAVSSTNTTGMAVSILEGSISDIVTALGLDTLRLTVASLVVGLNLDHVIPITVSFALATSSMGDLVLALLLGGSTLAKVTLASDRVNLGAGDEGTVLSSVLVLNLLDDGAETGEAGAVVFLLLNEREQLDAVSN